jgi:hypothetical protein
MSENEKYELENYFEEIFLYFKKLPFFPKEKILYTVIKNIDKKEFIDKKFNSEWFIVNENFYKLLNRNFIQLGNKTILNINKKNMVFNIGYVNSDYEIIKRDEKIHGNDMEYRKKLLQNLNHKLKKYPSDLNIDVNSKKTLQLILENSFLNKIKGGIYQEKILDAAIKKSKNENDLVEKIGSILIFTNNFYNIKINNSNIDVIEPIFFKQSLLERIYLPDRIFELDNRDKIPELFENLSINEIDVLNLEEYINILMSRFKQMFKFVKLKILNPVVPVDEIEFKKYIDYMGIYNIEKNENGVINKDNEKSKNFVYYRNDIDDKNYRFDIDDILKEYEITGKFLNPETQEELPEYFVKKMLQENIHIKNNNSHYTNRLLDDLLSKYNSEKYYSINLYDLVLKQVKQLELQYDGDDEESDDGDDEESDDGDDGVGDDGDDGVGDDGDDGVGDDGVGDDGDDGVGDDGDDGDDGEKGDDGDDGEKGDDGVGDDGDDGDDGEKGDDGDDGEKGDDGVGDDGDDGDDGEKGDDGDESEKNDDGE